MSAMRPHTFRTRTARRPLCAVELKRSPRCWGRWTQGASGGLPDPQKPLLLQAFSGVERRSCAKALRGSFSAGPPTDRPRRRSRTAHGR
jgi:hypothetical protein